MNNYYASRIHPIIYTLESTKHSEMYPNRLFREYHRGHMELNREYHKLHKLMNYVVEREEHG